MRFEVARFRIMHNFFFNFFEFDYPILARSYAINMVIDLSMIKSSVYTFGHFLNSYFKNLIGRLLCNLMPM